MRCALPFVVVFIIVVSVSADETEVDAPKVGYDIRQNDINRRDLLRLLSENSGIRVICIFAIDSLAAEAPSRLLSFLEEDRITVDIKAGTPALKVVQGIFRSSEWEVNYLRERSVIMIKHSGVPAFVINAADPKNVDEADQRSEGSRDDVEAGRISREADWKVHDGDWREFIDDTVMSSISSFLEAEFGADWGQPLSIESAVLEGESVFMLTFHASDRELIILGPRRLIIRAGKIVGVTPRR